MKATPARKLIPLQPVLEAEKGSFFWTLVKGYVIAQCIGLTVSVFTVSDFTCGATTRGKLNKKSKYLTCNSKNLNAYGFERVKKNDSKN